MLAVKPKSDAGAVKVVSKAFALLETLQNSSSGTGLSELASAVRLPKPTAHRILRTLEGLGYVEGNQGVYRTTDKLKELGHPPESALVRKLARPAMARILAEFEQTVNFAVLENGQLIYRDMLEGLRSMRMQSTPGIHLSLTKTALGRSIVAHWPAEASGLPAEMYAQIRRKGYALDLEESEPGLCCVGAAILGRDGRPVAAISVSGSSAVLREEVIRRAGGKLRRECEEISKALGWNRA
ncbi:MAG: IclR family transcriptional regulator [Acidimicrobiia bacterium]|nr:IclR family transcriptional regulator [Acidimicrobiia bacterium]